MCYCVVYSNVGPDTENEPFKLTHGNSKSLTAPYIKNVKSSIGEGRRIAR